MAANLPDDVDTLDDVKKLNELFGEEIAKKYEKYDPKHPFWDKISVFYGDITKIQVDAIVKAGHDIFARGGGVDEAIQRAAGHAQLQAECRKHDRPMRTGEAVIADAYKLSTHVKKIIHCVGPICDGGVTNERRKKLLSCYRRAIQLAEENGLRSIAFPCISTGIYGYDNRDAARTVIKFLWKYFSKEVNGAKWDRVVFCLFMDLDKKCYQHYIKELLNDPTYFDDEDESESEEEVGERRYPTLDILAARDGVLVIGDEKKKIHVNRESLASQSPFFDRLFYGEWKEKNMKEIVIGGVEYEEFSNIIRLVYGDGGGSLTVDNLHRVLQLADQFELKIVEERIVNCLLSAPSLTDPTSIYSLSIHQKLVISEQYNLPFLKDRLLAQYKDDLQLLKALSLSPELEELSVETVRELFKKSCDRI